MIIDRRRVGITISVGEEGGQRERSSEISRNQEELESRCFDVLLRCVPTRSF